MKSNSERRADTACLFIKCLDPELGASSAGAAASQRFLKVVVLRWSGRFDHNVQPVNAGRDLEEFAADHYRLAHGSTRTFHDRLSVGATSNSRT